MSRVRESLVPKSGPKSALNPVSAHLLKLIPKVNINCYVIIFYMFIKFLQYHLELTGEWQQNMEWFVSTSYTFEVRSFVFIFGLFLVVRCTYMTCTCMYVLLVQRFYSVFEDGKFCCNGACCCWLQAQPWLVRLPLLLLLPLRLVSTPPFPPTLTPTPLGGYIDG